jgi:hypothetical protein
MQEFIIDVTRIEEWQTISDLQSLEAVFQKAKSTIVNGESVILVRSDKLGKQAAFDTITTLDDLERYRLSVFKYL